MQAAYIEMGTCLLRQSLISLTSIIFLTSSVVYLFPFAFVSVNGDDCSYSNCTTDMYSSLSPDLYNRYFIPFPFRTPDQPQSCGLPGFELGCNNSNGTPLLSFPSGQSFKVRWISNSSREMEISDAVGGYCLQEKLVHFNSSGTPFRSKDGFTEFTLYTCPLTGDFPHSLLSSSSCWEIGCDRGRDNPVVCDVDRNGTTSLLMSNYGCDLIGNAKVAGNWASAYSFSFASSVSLTWDTPGQCVECESRGQECRSDPYNYTNIKCFPRLPLYANTTPSYASNKGVVTIVLVVMFLPIFLVGVCACCIRCIQIRRRGRPAVATLGNTPISQSHVNTTSMENQGSNVTSGLEQATLDTYPIVLVGDSGRILINMEDKTCPICLSDYEPRDILKSLPECLHRFHSDCIDEWLRAKAMCPVCRTMPPGTSS